MLYIYNAKHLISDGPTNKEIQLALTSMKEELDMLKAKVPQRPGSTGIYYSIDDAGNVVQESEGDCTERARFSPAQGCNSIDIFTCGSRSISIFFVFSSSIFEKVIHC